VPKTTCKMEAYCRTYQTCRMVPVCEPVCEEACPPACPTPCAPACPAACDWKSCFFQRLCNFGGCCK